MQRGKLDELHFITLIKTVPSIVRSGILSHVRASSVLHESIADEKVLARRAKVSVPGGRKLLEYANLYFSARNPMMYRLAHIHEKLCVLSVSPDVMNLTGVVISDRNASSNHARFAPGPNGLAIVDEELTYAEDWRDDNQIEYFRKKSMKCAEVLVPHCVLPEFIMGAYVSCDGSRRCLAASVAGLVVTIDGHLFFR